LLLQSSSLPEEDMLLINEHERIRKVYQHMSYILEHANRLKRILMSVIQWYALLKLSGTISLVHYFGPLWALTVSLVVILISQIYRCLSCRRVTRKMDEGYCKNDARNDKMAEMQILLNQRKHHDIVQAHLEEFVLIQSQRKHAQQGGKDREHACYTNSTKKLNQTVVNQPRKRANVNERRATLRIEPKAIKRSIQDLESKCQIGLYNHEDLVSTDQITTQKKKHKVRHLSLRPVLDQESSTYMHLISPEHCRPLVAEKPLFSDRSTLSDTTDFEYHSMEEFDDSSSDHLSVSAGSRKHLYSEDSWEKEINETRKKRQKCSIA
jgi:hypothetical protein